MIQQRAGEWLLKQLNQMKDSNNAIHLKKENILSVDGEMTMTNVASTTLASSSLMNEFLHIPEEESLASFVSRNQRDKVRQFVEELMARMLDGPLDDVSVGQLSNDDNCE